MIASALPKARASTPSVSLSIIPLMGHLQLPRPGRHGNASATGIRALPCSVVEVVIRTRFVLYSPYERANGDGSETTNRLANVVVCGRRDHHDSGTVHRRLSLHQQWRCTNANHRDAKEMVTDDPEGVTFWKITNGIRLSGMPGFVGVLSEEQRWQLAMLLAHADKIPPSVRTALIQTK